MGSVKKAPEPAEPHPLLAPEPTIMMGGPPPQSPASGTTGSTQVDPTIVMGETPKTQNRDASSSTSASRSSLNDGATPRTSTSTSAPGRAYAPLKSAPKEVVEAAKDAQRIFGKYILLKELGRGGAGVVYKAWDTTLAQFVALKFLRDQEGGDSETDTGSQAVADFQREARMSAKLRHPNIIRIYEMGSMSGRYYLSMDYIEGGSLLEYIHGGKERNSDTHFNSDVKRYLGIMIKIVEAVHAAHSNNPPVVHRDLKPHNVLVDKQHNPYVVDFGLAKEVELSTSQNTVTGAVKGTPSYMAPEQAEGRNKDVDARTDVYCLGAILYEMLTGRPPFVGGNVRIVLNAIVTQLPDRPNLAIQTALLEKSDGEHRPKPVDRPLETICMKALEKAKADRYQTAQELADDLKRYLNDEDIQAQEPGLWRRFRRQIRQHPLISGSVAASILCAGVIGGALYYTSKVDTGLGKIEAIAREHLAAKDWAAMKNDADSLRRVKPRHPLIAELESAVAAHETDLKNRRDVWDAGLKKLASDGPAALDSLRPPYRASGELRQEFSDRLQRALVELQSAGENEARELIGGGADERWLKADVKKAARNCRDRLAYLAGLSKDADFPFKASAQGSALRESLGKLLAYEGLFTLRVNVAPFARVVVKREGKVLAEEWTPLGVRNLEVAGAYELDLVAPGGKPLQIPLTDLKHGAVVVVSGDIGRRDVKAATQ
jgi:serine/threonine protein kinase